MDVNMSRVHLLPGMLEAVLSSNGAGPAVRAESRAERFLWQVRGAVPTQVRANAAAALHGPLTRGLTMRLSALGVDWSKTPAFLLPSDHFGQVRLNVRGRERDGIVEPLEVEALVARIRDGLLSFRDPDGEPAVVAVDRAVDVLAPGPRLGRLPDLVVRWSERPSARVDHVNSSEHGRVGRPGVGSGRSGAHRPQAWALLVPTTSAVSPTESASVEDIVPTICEVLGVDAADLTGRPLLARG
jgi:predicted AlkP superfamily phosphohydrolase/phosphomutase